MPKDTFNNLSEEKKQKIFDAAIQEFSTRRFSEASINQIVKTAKIPRGSFYQYFDDKEDLYLYMFMKILNEKQEIIRYAKAIDPDADVFENCIQATKASFEWSKTKPEYQKYTQISMLMELDHSEFIAKLRTASGEGLRRIIDRDKQRGIIKPEIDSNLIVEIIFTLISKEFFETGLDQDKFEKRLSDIIRIIKEGVC